MFRNAVVLVLCAMVVGGCGSLDRRNPVAPDVHEAPSRSLVDMRAIESMPDTITLEAIGPCCAQLMSFKAENNGRRVNAWWTWDHDLNVEWSSVVAVGYGARHATAEWPTWQNRAYWLSEYYRVYDLGTFALMDDGRQGSLHGNAPPFPVKGYVVSVWTKDNGVARWYVPARAAL